MALFALDHNYPEPIMKEAAPYLEAVELVWIQDIDSRLPEFDDWELLLALHHHERSFDGLISNDANMLNQEKELAVLGYTRLTLVAPDAVGHDPIRSTGLVLAHIEDIAARTTPRRPQIWKLHRRTNKGAHPDDFMEVRARRLGVDPIDLRKSASPARTVLESDPLA